MTTKDKATRRKLSLLELAQEMSNVCQWHIWSAPRGKALSP